MISEGEKERTGFGMMNEEGSCGISVMCEGEEEMI